MKKLLLSSFVLLFFSTSLLIFQISCQKSADAQSPTGSTQQNKVIFINYSLTPNKEQGSIWVMNYDGTGATKLNINLPANFAFGDIVRISPDAKTIFFSVIEDRVTERDAIYSCSIDGSNLKKIYFNPNGASLLGAAY